MRYPKRSPYGLQYSSGQSRGSDTNEAMPSRQCRDSPALELRPIKHLATYAMLVGISWAVISLETEQTALDAAWIAVQVGLLKTLAVALIDRLWAQLENVSLTARAS